MIYDFYHDLEVNEDLYDEEQELNEDLALEELNEEELINVFIELSSDEDLGYFDFD